MFTLIFKDLMNCIHMVKFKWVYIIFFIQPALIFPQGEGNIWYFGQNAGLDFNSGSPVALTNGQLNTTEGCSTISNASGQLLFYTDGITVWNKNHQIMANGTGLMGHISSTQSAIIVPKPGAANLYYIFTTPEKADPIGARYSVVDMDLNGGLGDVTTIKNVLIKTPVCEKIAVAKKDNIDEYWVVFHGFDSNSFFTYNLSATGISTTPITSNAGTIITVTSSGLNDNAIGYLKFSPNGRRLLCINSYVNSELFDFDTVTGVVSNARIINAFPNPFYGAEFSPSSDLLYLSGGGFSNPNIFQYDITAPNISATERIIFNSFNSEGFGSLQLAPNNKIYVARFDRTSLAVINNPDIYGTGCNFQLNGVSLATKISKIGLPQFVQTVFKPFFTAHNFCFTSNTQFTLDTSIVPNSVLWNFGDTQTSTVFNPTHQYATPGNYNVTVTLTTNNGSYTKSRLVNIVPVPIIVNSITNQIICGSPAIPYNLSQFNTMVLGTQSPSVFGVSYFSTMTDALNNTGVLQSNVNLTQGINTFYVKVFNLSNTKCYVVDSFTVELYNNPLANIPNNIFLCDTNSNTGTGIFNLLSNTSTILDGQNPSQYSVSYHLSQSDADTNNSPLPNNYQNISNPQTIYVRVQSNNLALNCFATTSFQIGFYKKPLAHQPLDFFVCDDENNDGQELFDLTQQDNGILGNQSSVDFKITYYFSQSDANNGINDLNPNYTNVSNPQTIYARIENRLSSSCYDTVIFQLIVKAKPVLTIDEIYSICEGTSETITAPVGFSSYSWSNGETSNTAVITQAGEYSLTVTKNYGTIICDVTKTFSVYNSNAAVITNVDTRDWTDNQNTITIEVSGDGDYEYSVDGIHFQNSNIFYGLTSGQYTVYVNDKKGCGTTTKNVLLLMYPKFFTPNGDGINDIWHIKFSNSEPDMELLIFDRWGKKITAFEGSGLGWDGTINGKPVCADDYWFVVRRQNGQEYRGHFTLKR